MKTKKLKINIPSSMNEISLGRYQEFVTQTDREDLTEQDIAIAMLDIFLDIKSTKSLEMTFKSMTEIGNKLAEVLSEKPTLIQKFKMGDTEFGFIPKLDEMTFGEYIDLDTYISDWSQMHKAMAVLFRPIALRKGMKYTLTDYEGDLYHEAMKNMPLSVAMGSLVFFYRLERELQNSMIPFLEEEAKEIQTALQQSGVGINQSINLRKET